MAKKLKFDEGGDSDELQALFDSIASSPAKPEPKVVAAPTRAPVAQKDASGDDDELQALFDSVAAEFDAEPPEEAVAAASGPTPSSDVVGSDQSREAMYTRIGQMTRKVHNALRALGNQEELQDVVVAIPDARERLTYIAQMTEQAASRVLNATDIAQPIQNKVQADAMGLQQQWEKLYSNQLSIEEFKTLSNETRAFLGNVVEGTRATNEQLMEIMMAQDFQDLTGQVIKKVVDLAQRLETELLEVLLEVTPPGKRPRIESTWFLPVYPPNHLLSLYLI
jgi:chemotaxis protein CheZ